MIAGTIGFVETPDQGTPIPPGARFMVDNGRFSGKLDPDGRLLVGDRAPRWHGDLWFEAYLAKFRPRAADCAFVVAPDVPFEPETSLARSRPWLHRIRRMGFPAALAVQGDIGRLPWNEFDVVFLAGDMGFKHGIAAADYVRQARDRGIPVHWGRCNSQLRIRQAHGMGCDSADGGYLRAGPDKNLGRLLGWLADLDRNGAQTFI